MIRFKPPITSRRVRFALVGCGRIAQNHFTALEAHRDRAELVAVCDIDPEALRAAAEKTHAKPYASLAALLAKADVAIVGFGYVPRISSYNAI